MHKVFQGLVAVVAAGLVAAFVSAPATAQEPRPLWAALDESLTETASAIVSSAPVGEPLKVVTTIVGDEGPEFVTQVADTVAEARRIVEAAQDADDTVAVSMAQPVSIADSNDTHRSQQWALTQLEAESLWSVSQGQGVRVAVVDTGVRAAHPDLSGVLTGYDAITRRTGQNDANGHGTHVAGIIAATANNNRGVAGLAPGVTILPVRVLDADGNGTTDQVAEGIRWAADNGARVINLSLAGTGNDPAVSTAVSYARSKNAVVVAAAGNTACPLLGSNATTYPAAYTGVIGVAAVDPAGKAASFSSCGSWVDVAAPGTSIMSTIIPSSRGLGCLASAEYCSISGTSMAAGFVSANAAVLAQRNPGMSESTIASRIQQAATDLGTKGRDNKFGHGLINPLESVGGASTSLATPANFRVTATGTTTVNLAWNASSGATAYRLWYGTNANGSSATFKRVTGTSTQITGLKAGTTYYVDIAAEKGSEMSAYTPKLSFTTTGGSAKPATPANFRVTATGTTTVNLAWNASSGATAYRLWYGTNANGSKATFKRVTGTSTQITGLKAGTTYYVDIAAENGSGMSAYTPKLSFTTAGTSAAAKPPTPTGFRVTSTGTTTVNLAWNASSGATSYRLWYGTNANGSKATFKRVTGTSTQITGLKPKTRYYVDVAAENGSGMSAYTPKLSFTTR